MNVSKKLKKEMATIFKNGHLQNVHFSFGRDSFILLLFQKGVYEENAVILDFMVKLLLAYIFRYINVDDV